MLRLSLFCSQRHDEWHYNYVLFRISSNVQSVEPLTPDFDFYKRFSAASDKEWRW